MFSIKHHKNIMSKRYYNLKSGFSLIEALIAMSILILIGAAAWIFQKDVFSLNRIFSVNLVAQEEMRKVLKTMSAEIRSASPSSIGAYAIAQTATSSFIFYSNADDEPLKERIRYFVDGGTLKKGVIKASGEPLVYNLADEIISDLAHNMANGTTSVFSYYDTDYDGATLPLEEPIDISAVRMVKIMVMVDSNLLEPPGPATLTTQVSIRNLKDNL